MCDQVSKWHMYAQQGGLTSGHQIQSITSLWILAPMRVTTVNLSSLRRHLFQWAKHTRIKLCGFSSFTCEMKVINTLFLYLTGSPGKLKDICKQLLTKRLLCVSAKFILNNETINKIEIPPQILSKILPGRFISITENNSYLLKEDTTRSYGPQNKEIDFLPHQSLDSLI